MSRNNSKKTVLATAYAIDPYKGSEDGMGWNYVYQIARFQHVIAVTRENNQEAIEQYLAHNPDEVHQNMTFLYYDLPRKYRFWKRDSRGAMFYVLLWHFFVARHLRKSNLQFDIAHHLNFHNDWTPSYLWKLGKPFIWGPIGHHPFIPKTFRYRMGWTSRIKQRITWMVKNYFWNWNNALRQTLTKADYIWCMHREVLEVLPVKGKNHHVSPSVAAESMLYGKPTFTDSFQFLSAGRLVPMKGFDLAIQSFAEFVSNHPAVSAKLTIIGKGPDKDKLAQLISDLNMQRNIEIIDWMPRSTFLEHLQGATGFLFPSHEGAGMVVPEALSFGIPVITIDNCGPGEFITPEAGYVVASTDYRSTILNLASALEDLCKDKAHYLKMRLAARELFEARFDWNRRGEQLQAIYNQF